MSLKNLLLGLEKNEKNKTHLKQAGAELCKAQFKLGIAKKALQNRISLSKLAFTSFASFPCLSLAKQV